MCAFHNLDTDWGASFASSTGHFLDVLPTKGTGRGAHALEGRQVIALYDLFQRNDAERRAVTG